MNAPTNTKRETSTVDGTPGSFSAASRLPRGGACWRRKRLEEQQDDQGRQQGRPGAQEEKSTRYPYLSPIRVPIWTPMTVGAVMPPVK